MSNSVETEKVVLDSIQRTVKQKLEAAQKVVRELEQKREQHDELERRAKLQVEVLQKAVESLEQT